MNNVLLTILFVLLASKGFGQKNYQKDTVIGNYSIHLKLDNKILTNEKDNYVSISIKNVISDNIKLCVYPESIIKRDKKKGTYSIIPSSKAEKVNLMISIKQKDGKIYPVGIIEFKTK